MATISFVKARHKWRVRWQAKSRQSAYTFKGSRYFYEKDQAYRFFADIEAQEKLVRSGTIIPTESIPNVISKFFRHIKRFTLRTQQHYKDVMARFAKSLPKNIIRIHQLDTCHIREYLYKLRDAGLKNRTLNAHLTVIKSFCRFYSEDFSIHNPAAGVKMLVEDPPKPRFIEPAEYKKLLDLAPDLARNRIIFLANTGLRASEFAGLKPNCFNQDLTAITITGKGRKRRTIPLNKSARAALPKLTIGTKNALFLQFSRLAKKIGIEPFGPHALRHYFATQLLLKGIPIIKVSKLLGHNSVKTTERIYAHILPGDLSNATDVLD